MVAPTTLAACVAAVAFEGVVEDWIHRFKYPGPGLSGLDPAPGRTLGRLVVEAATRSGGDVAYEPRLAALAAAVAADTLPGDVVVTMGAGSIERTGAEVLARLEATVHA